MKHRYDIIATDRHEKRIPFRNVPFTNIHAWGNYFMNKGYMSALIYYKPLPSAQHPLINGMQYFFVAGTWDQGAGLQLLYFPRDTPQMKRLRRMCDIILAPSFNSHQYRNSRAWVHRW